MTSFDDELRSALAREQPPEGFAERVIAAAGCPREMHRRAPMWRFAAMAACLAVAAGGAFEYRRYQGQRAKEHVLVALRIAGKQWNKAQRQVFEYDPRRVAARE